MKNENVRICMNPFPCDEDGCPGWDWFNQNEVQRCDDCKRFANDDSARRHIRRCFPCATRLVQRQKQDGWTR